MICLSRNKRTIWYALFKERTPVQDVYGNDTGDPVISYEDPVQIEVNVSEATGRSMTQQFGNLENYDKVIVTDDMDCPIDANSVLFVDREPETSLDGDLLYDYVVRRVSKSLNYISIAISKVRVS